ncbi:MAG: hypothetical protein QXL94_09340 [Candidatus Parvarchaeum sp.]
MMESDMKQYLDGLIEQFRKEKDKLSENEKRFFNAYGNLSAPCQIDVFLLNKPIELQLLLISHSSDSKDKEIVVNGPYEPQNFLNKLEEYVKTDKKWQRILPNETRYRNLDDNSKISYGKIVIGAMASFFKSMNNLMFANIKKDEMFSIPIMFVDAAAEGVFGDIRRIDATKIFEGKVKLAKQLANIPTITQNNKVITALAEPNAKTKGSAFVFSGSNMPTNAKGYGVIFYPPIWVDKRPEQTLAEQVMHSPVFRKKAFDFDFLGRKLIFNSDGFIGIEGESKEEAMKVFNTFFGIAHLFGVFCYAVNEDDIADITIDKNKMEIGDITMQGHSERMQLMDITQDSKANQRFKIIKQETIKPIVDLTNKIINNQIIVSQLTFLLEGYTYFIHSEYSQSFIMDWLIIEKYFANKWDELLNKREITGNRKRDFNDADKWDSYHKLELLNFVGEIDNEKYLMLRNFNTKRNHLVHKGEQIKQEDAEILYKLALDIVKSNIDLQNGK